MIHEVWQHHRWFREKKELRKVGVKNHCNQCLYLAFREMLRKKSGRQKLSQVYGSPCRGYLDLYSKWHDKSELSFLGDASGKFPDHGELQSWIMNFRTEVCSKAKNPTRALQWIKEIKAAESMDDLITPKSITGKDFHDYEELDLMMASAMKRCYDKQTYFLKTISVEEQRAQKDNRFLRGRQIAYLIFEYFRLSGSHDEIQGFSGLLSIKLEHDDIQDFDLRWEEALWLTIDLPSDKVLERLYASNLQDSSQAQTIVAQNNREILWGGGQRYYHRLRMCVKLHFEQGQRSKNFRILSEIAECVAKFLHQAEDRRVLSVEGKWVLFKRRLLKFSTFACLGKPRDISGRSEEHRRI